MGYTVPILGMHPLPATRDKPESCPQGGATRGSGFSFVKAIDGYLKIKTAEGLSPRTISPYEFTLSHWLEYIGNREVSEIEDSYLIGYMAWLRTEYKPQRWNGSTERLSAKSIGNVWATFRSFFGWLQVEFKFPNPVKEINAPIPTGSSTASLSNIFAHAEMFSYSKT